MKLGAYVQEWIDRNERPIRWLARKSDISNSYLLDLLKGKWKPSPEKLRGLASAMGAPYAKLLILAGYLKESDIAALQKESQGRIPPDLMAALRDPEIVKIVGKLWRYKNEDPPFDVQRLCDRMLSLSAEEMAAIEVILSRISPNPSTT